MPFPAIHSSSLMKKLARQSPTALEHQVDKAHHTSFVSLMHPQATPTSAQFLTLKNSAPQQSHHWDHTQHSCYSSDSGNRPKHQWKWMAYTWSRLRSRKERE